MAASTSSDVISQDRLSAAALPERGVVRVSGPDAQHLLQGLVTQDLELLQHQPAVYAALLTPQGKVLFDFFVVRMGDDYLLDCKRDKVVDLIKRLALYRLRAKVTFDDVSAAMAVLALWGEGAPPKAPDGGVVFVDPRWPDLGWRALLPSSEATRFGDCARPASAGDWHLHRIGLGVPDGGSDFAYSDAFPHEADIDQLRGVSFTKGCYVGQEVVSRMQHRGTARKRIVMVRSRAPLAGSGAISAGDLRIGDVTSSAGHMGLALVRLDRAAEAKAKGEALTCAGQEIELELPPWAQFSLAPVPVPDAKL